MAISIDWGTRIINVPKSDLTLIQSTPTEIRELNLNTFRLTLKDLEDDEEGMIFPNTHNHNTEVNVGGLTLARVVEIINGYTVTFEDGQYAVNLVGANSNVGDVVNVNQVSVRSFNSAGMTSSPAIEYASYNGGVTLDPNSSYAGTVYPIGTPQQPVNNLTDALLVAAYRGFNKIFLNDDLAFDDSYNLDGFVIQGLSEDVVVTIDTIASVNDMRLENLTLVDSVLDGNIDVRNCSVRDVSYVNGHLANCGLAGTITLGGNRKSVIIDCYTIDQDNPPTINMGVSGNDLAMPNYSGIVTITNLSGADNEVGIGMDAGFVTLDSTVTAGTVIISGIGILADNSNGATVNTDGILNKQQISQAVWDESIANHLITGTTGLSVGIAQYGGAVHVNSSGSPGTIFPVGTERVPVDNMADAIVIANNIGVSTFHFESNLTITGGTYAGYAFVGRGRQAPVLTFDNTTVMGCQFKEISVKGTFTNGSIAGFYFCSIEDVYDISVTAYECVIQGELRLTDAGESNLYTCTDGVPGIGIPDIQVNTCTSLGIWNWNGGIRLSNMIVDSAVTCMIAQGRLWVDDTCVDGDIIVKGLADLRGETGGTTIDHEGLITKDTIAEATFDAVSEVVYYDATSGNSGTAWPVGSSAYPVDNISDCIAICQSRGIPGITFNGTFVISQDLVGYRVKGTSSSLSEVAVITGVDVSNTMFELCLVTGTMVNSSNVQLMDALSSDLYGFDGVIINGGFKNILQVKSGGQLIAKNVSTAGANDIIDANGAVAIAVDFNGVFTLQNLINGGYFQAGGSFGQVVIDSTVNGGVGKIYGTIELVDNATNMTWIGEGVINRDTISDAVWNSSNGLSVLSDLSFIKGIEGGKWEIAEGEMIFYTDDNVTELARFALTYDVNQNPISRERI